MMALKIISFSYNISGLTITNYPDIRQKYKDLFFGLFEVKIIKL